MILQHLMFMSAIYLIGQSSVMFHVLPAQVPSLLATWHTNILCIVYTKEDAKKVLQENKTKRQATRACVRHQGEGACVSGGTWARGCGWVRIRDRVHAGRDWA